MHSACELISFDAFHVEASRALHRVQRTPHASAKCGNSSNCNCRRGLQTHGGLTPAALDSDVRSCIAKIAFLRQTCALRNKSGGRKPPVGNETPLQSTTAHPRRHACVQPGAAGVSQPWFGQRARKRVSGTLRTTFVLPNHGGLMPAAPVRPFVGRGTMLDSRGTASVWRATVG
jgi:hypothetical protein